VSHWSTLTLMRPHRLLATVGISVTLATACTFSLNCPSAVASPALPPLAPSPAMPHAGPPTAGSASPVPAGLFSTGTTARWSWPLTGSHEVMKPYAAPQTAYGRGHRGIDLAAAAGDVVYAPADAEVSFAGEVVDRPLVSLVHDGDRISSLEPVTPLVSVGQRVRAGTAVGVVADGGHCGGACVHVGVRLHGRYVSPLLYLESVPRAVLLPVAPARDTRSAAQARG
jgi:murein DD-endopeptidase MepM/ murein hydrolase activator NlpD